MKFSFVSLVFLKRFLVLSILLFSSISLHWPRRKAFYLSLLFFGTLHSNGCIFPFSPLPFTSLLFSATCKASSDNHFAFLEGIYAHHYTTNTILPFCISFYWECSWSLPPIQCHKPLSIVLQAFCLSNLIPWISLSLPLYNHKGFDLGHTWIV